MRNYRRSVVISLFFSLTCLVPVLPGCGPSADKKAETLKTDSLVYLNHSDSARYVGMNTCRQCHQEIYNSFINTGMGKSFDIATVKKSSADFSNARIYDKIADLHYQAFWKSDSLFMKEFRTQKKDTLHSRVEQVNYIIGSGQHTNSHLQTVNGYINQMPMTFYTQKKHWDLPPGFENGLNTRFSRKIGLECMTCHNAFPEFVMGSENKYKSVPSGINCERCHGPGSLHVAERQTGSRVDTSRYVDYTIVNPSKLPVDLQFDICQRCHLQGNAVLKEGKSFFDFKPGQKLSNYISVFLPKYKNADEEFIMASHADRLKQSPCFIKSHERKATDALRPAKNAMTCITCHNPHVSVQETNKNVFNDACAKCHGQTRDGKDMTVIHKSLDQKKISDCVSCHMPVSGATDIPHVSVHDHFIRKPVTKAQKEKIKAFVGLYSINEKDPDYLTRAKAYIDQYDKFDHDAFYLDSAANLLKMDRDARRTFHAAVQLSFVRNDFAGVLRLVNAQKEEHLFNEVLVKRSYENQHAWTSYRIAESFSNTGNKEKALKWFKKAIDLTPYNLEFRNKLGSAYAAMNDLQNAEKQYEFIMTENPRVVSAYANLGYLKLIQGFPAEALRLYNIGKSLDPDNEALLLNLSGYYLFMKDTHSAAQYLKQILKKNPQNEKVKSVLKQLNA